MGSLAKPFVVLGFFIFIFYIWLIYHNYSERYRQFYAIDTLKLHSFFSRKHLKIQKDRYKIFPPETNFLTNTSFMNFNSIQQLFLDSQFRKCDIFNIFVYPSTGSNSSTAEALRRQLNHTHYAVAQSYQACIQVVVLDNIEDLDKLNNLKNDESKYIIYLLNGVVKPSLGLINVFGPDISGANGIYFAEEEIREDVILKPSILNSQQRKPLLQICSEYPYELQIDGCDQENSLCANCDNINNIRNSTAMFVYVGFISKRYFHLTFYLALQRGAIPVVKSLDFQHLPLSDFIHWHTAVLRISSTNVNQLLKRIKQLNEAQLMEMQRKGQYYYKNYFSDLRANSRSTLSAIRYRMQVPAPLTILQPTTVFNFSTHTAGVGSQNVVKLQTPFTALRNAEHVFNRDPTFLDNYAPLDCIWDPTWVAETNRFIFSTKNTHITESNNRTFSHDQFTIVISAYKRDQQLQHVLAGMHGMHFLRQVIVLWNDLNRIPPPNTFWPYLHVPVYVVKPPRNSLNARFLPYNIIDTEAVFIMDDDFELSNTNFEFLFRIWRENHDTIVGVNQRLAYVDPHTGIGYYRDAQASHYNIILTSGAFLHWNYLVAYNNLMPQVRYHVDQVQNCEDLAMNFLIAYLSRKPPIKATSISYTTGSYNQDIGLSQRPDHYIQRAHCVEIFVRLYGFNPLLSSENRAEKIHLSESEPS